MQCAAGGVDTQKVKVEEFAAALRESRAEAAELRRRLADMPAAAAAVAGGGGAAGGSRSPVPAERQPPLLLSPRVLPSSVKAAAQHRARAKSVPALHPLPGLRACKHLQQHEVCRHESHG